MAAAHSIWHNRELIVVMARRDVIGRYRGSLMGVAWSFFHPLLMLLVYTFVFGFVFQARWGADQSGGKAGFAIVLFVGLIVHGLLSECANRSPALILQHVNYVKKVVFPLEILPVVTLASALFHSMASLLVFFVAAIFVHGAIPVTALLLPVVIVPLLLLTLGLSWMLASLGVYLRDISQTIGIVTTVMLFLSPVFYPVSAVPEAFRAFIYANPLTFLIDQARAVLIWGQAPDWGSLALFTLMAGVFARAGFWWFQRTRKGFADVL